jgi:hypothetical protein
MLNFLCRFFTCEPTGPEPPASRRTSAHLGQKKARVEAQSEEQLRHMEGKDAFRPTQQDKSR